MSKVRDYIKKTVDTIKLGKEYVDSSIVDEDHVYIGKGDGLTINGNYCIIGPKTDNCKVNGSYCIIQGRNPYVTGSDNMFLYYGEFSTLGDTTVFLPYKEKSTSESLAVYELEKAIKKKVAYLKDGNLYSEMVDKEDPQVKYERFRDKLNRGEALTTKENAFFCKMLIKDKRTNNSDNKQNSCVITNEINEGMSENVAPMDVDEQHLTEKMDIDDLVYNQVSSLNMTEKNKLCQTLRNDKIILTDKIKDNQSRLLSKYNTSIDEQQKLLENSKKSDNKLNKTTESKTKIQPDNGKLCIICFSNEINLILLPCKHAIMCDTCFKELTKRSKNKQIICSKCRSKVTTHIEFVIDGVN